VLLAMTLGLTKNNDSVGVFPWLIQADSTVIETSLPVTVAA